MSCLRPARVGELTKPTTIIAIQGKRGVISLYWAPVLTKPGLLGEKPRPDVKPSEKHLPPRILGVVDLEKLAVLDPSRVAHRFGMWRGKGPGTKGPGELSNPERDAERDRLKGGER